MDKNWFVQLMDTFKGHFFKRHMYYLAGMLVLISTGVPWLHKHGYLDIPQSLTAFGHGLTVLAILFAGFQFRANHDWNRRDAAMLALRHIDECTRDDIIVLDEAFNYIRKKIGEKILTKEIHYKICKIDSDGKLLTDDGDCFCIDHDKNGAKIKASLRNVLNSYEHLCVGIMEGTFDEKVVYRIEAGNILSAYFIFEDYIKHLNNKMYPDRDGKIYENLEYIAKKFKDTERKGKKQPKEREKTA